MDLRIIIAKLLSAGEDLTDAAEKCGHDDELDEWNKVSNSARKEIGEDFIRSLRDEENARRSKQGEKRSKRFDDGHISAEDFFNLK